MGKLTGVGELIGEDRKIEWDELIDRGVGAF